MPKIKHEPSPRDNIGRNIRILLAARGEKQSWLARRMNVSVATVSNWINGKVMMQLDDLDRIAALLHTTPAELYSSPAENAEKCIRFVC